MINDVDNLKTFKLKRRKKRSKSSPKRKEKAFRRFLFGMCVLLIILGLIFAFADIGGNIILELAKNYLNENYQLSLNAEKITGNPVKGYTLHNFSLDDNSSQNILSAGYLSGHINFLALLTGKIRLAEIEIGSMNMNVEEFISAAQKLTRENLTGKEIFTTDKFYLLHSSLLNGKNYSPAKLLFSASPAFAADVENIMPDIPLDYFKIKDSKFFSQIGTLEVKEIIADLKKFDIEIIDAAFNEIPISGKIDMGEGAGLTGINSSELNFGSGKILATGGLYGETLDFHASCENFSLEELTAFSTSLKAEDFDGTANFNIDAAGKLDNVKIFATIDYKGSKVYGFPVERASANVNYGVKDNSISVSNIQANVFNVPIQGEVYFANNSIRIKLDGSEANLDGLDKILGLPELKGLKGKVSLFNANISGTMKELNGLVNFTAPRISYNGRAFTNIRAQLKLLKSDTAHLDGKFNFEGSQGYLQGQIASVLKSPSLNVTAKIVDLDVKRVQNMIPDASDYKLNGKITASVNVKGSVNNPVISGSLNSQEFSGFEQTITKPEIDFTFTNKTLVLSKTKGTLNGMPINLTGTIKPLPSENPGLNINATILMSPAALKNYVPDIEEYNLKGNINAGIKITGSVNNPSVRLLASSENLQAMDMINAKNLELTTALGGDLTKLDKINLNVSAKNLTASGVTFSDVNAKLDKDGDKITLSSFNSQSGTGKNSGKISGSGFASVSGKSPMNFNFEFTKLDLGMAAFDSGSLKISGTLPNVAINFNADVEGFGPTNLNFTLSTSGNNLTGKGALTSSALKIYGINITNINLPLTYSANRFTSSNGTANLYGGSAKNSFAFNTETMTFTNNLEASNVDINALIQDASGGLDGGKITGKGKLTLRLNGSAKDKLTYSGSGNFSTGAGSITGFKWLDILSKVHGTKGINYASINAPLTLQTGKLILRSGSIVNANKNDPIYTYAKLTQNGTIDFSGSEVRLNLMTESNINYQLINAIQGGTKGGLEAILKNGVKGLEDSLKNFLSGGMKEAEKRASTGDFRIVSLRISGKAVSPSFSSLKIGPSTLKTDTQQNNSSDNKQQDNLKERIIDRTIDMIIPDKKEQQQNAQPQQQNTRPKIEDKVKEELRKGLQKGLGGLFKK